MSVQITIVGSSDRKLEELIRASGLRPIMASAVDLLTLTHPGAAQPDVLVMDVRGQGQIPSALSMLKRQHPGTSVVLVASELVPSLILDAMRAGVNECVAEPVTAEALGAAIGRVIAQRTSPVGGKVFAFVGAKGGVGATTLAVNVATALAREDPGTLLIDMHSSGGDAAILLGAEPRFSVTDAIENTHRLDLAFFDGLTCQTEAGVTLLASPERASSSTIDVHRTRLLLDFAAHNFRFTILDVPRSHAVVLDALESATEIIVVTSQELASIRGASRIAAALNRRYGRDNVSVVVSRFDKGAEIGVDDIERAVRGPVRFRFPSDYRLAIKALNAGRPFVMEGGSKLSASVGEFTESLYAEVDREPAPARARVLRARLGALRWMTS